MRATGRRERLGGRAGNLGVAAIFAQRRADRQRGCCPPRAAASTGGGACARPVPTSAQRRDAGGAYSSPSAAIGATSTVRAKRGGRRTPDRARVLRTMTSPRSARTSRAHASLGRRARSEGGARTRRVPPRWPGRRRLTRLYSSSTSVLDRRGGEQQEEAGRQARDERVRRGARVLERVRLVDDDEVPRKRRRPASRCRGDRAVRQRGDDDTAACPEGRRFARISGPSVVRQSMPKFAASSARHWLTSEGGTRTSARSTRPRSRYSERTSPASTVLPRPTSSASSARPRKTERTLRAVSSWCESLRRPWARSSARRESNDSASRARAASRARRTRSRRSEAVAASASTPAMVASTATSRSNVGTAWTASASSGSARRASTTDAGGGAAAEGAAWSGRRSSRPGLGARGGSDFDVAAAAGCGARRAASRGAGA